MNDKLTFKIILFIVLFVAVAIIMAPTISVMFQSIGNNPLAWSKEVTKKIEYLYDEEAVELAENMERFQIIFIGREAPAEEIPTYKELHRNENGLWIIRNGSDSQTYIFEDSAFEQLVNELFNDYEVSHIYYEYPMIMFTIAADNLIYSKTELSDEDLDLFAGSHSKLGKCWYHTAFPYGI